MVQRPRFNAQVSTRVYFAHFPNSKLKLNHQISQIFIHNSKTQYGTLSGDQFREQAVYQTLEIT